MPTMGRPRAFDTERALDAAMEVFWRRGYEGATMRELTEAMGINRPALYSAFGSKRGLFFRAIDLYYSLEAVHTFHALLEPTAIRVTEQYLRRSVEQLTNPDRPVGCFVLQSALVCGPANADLAQHMANLREAAEKELRKRYLRAQVDGDLPPDEDAASLARVVVTFRHGLAVMACSGTSRPDLEDAVGRFLAPWTAHRHCPNSTGCMKGGGW